MWTVDEGDDPDDWEDTDDSDVEDDVSQTIRCPHCDAEIYEDAEQCPVCGNYVIPDTNPLRDSSRSLAWLLLGLLGMAAVIVALLIC